MLEREGIAMNHKKLRRLYAEEGLSVKRRRGRKRATGVRAPIDTPSKPNERWSLDFLSDVFEPGRRFRIFAVMMIARANALASSLIRRFPARASPANSTS